jgi:hypothetical protein
MEYAKRLLGAGADKRAYGAGYKHAGYGTAEAIVRLGGYSNPTVWDLTPRQLSAYLFIKDKIDKEAAITYILHAFYSSQGTPEAINRVLRDIREELQ